MSSLPSQMYLSQHAPSPSEALGELLEDVRVRVARIDASLEETKESPLDLHDSVKDMLDELDTVESQYAQIGEMLLRALLAGHGHEVAALCIEWTALETLRLSVPETAGSHGGSNGFGRSRAVRLPRMDMDSSPVDDVTDTSSFRTVEVSTTPQRQSVESILARIAEPVVERERIAEVIPEEKSPPADLSTIDASDFFAKGQGFDEQPSHQRDELTKNLKKVQELIRDAGIPPKTFLRLAEANEPMGWLNQLIEKKTLKRIASLPTAWHHAATDYITAYARHMQEAICETFTDVHAFDREFEKIFRTLTNFSVKTRPGYIIGLKKDSQPTEGKTWHQAVQCRRRKLDLLAEEPRKVGVDVDGGEKKRRAARTDVLRRLHEAVSSEACTQTRVVDLAREAVARNIDPQHPRLLSALRDHRETLEPYDDLKVIVRALLFAEREEALSGEQDDDSTSDLDEPWPFKEHTEGKKLAIIGGNRKQGVEEKLREAFALEEVVWVSTAAGKHARQRKFRAGFKNGSYDFVVAIQNLVGHAWTEMIFNDRPEVTVAALSSGYGVKAVGRALARYSDWG